MLKAFDSRIDCTNWSYRLYRIAEVIHDTIRSYRIDFLPERYNESLLRSTNLTPEENHQVLKKLIFIQKFNK